MLRHGKQPICKLVWPSSRLVKIMRDILLNYCASQPYWVAKLIAEAAHETIVVVFVL